MKTVSSSVKNIASLFRDFLRFKRTRNCSELIAYKNSIDAYNKAQSNTKMLNAIRQYNHSIINSLNRITPLSGRRILDVGASPHGYALEASLETGVSEYIGIGLDITEEFYLETKKARAKLMPMNAESLTFGNDEFDVIVTMSTFEHIENLDVALSEFHRVLKHQGCVLISFEPIWSCSYGHHLHHLGEISKLIPDWAHLLWSMKEMEAYMHTCWPTNAPISVIEACEWIYEDNVLNRKDIREIRKIFSECQFHIEWMTPLLDEPRNEAQLIAVGKKTGLSRDELMAKGLSSLLQKH